MTKMATKAKVAALTAAQLPTRLKNKLLCAMAENIIRHQQQILEANHLDMEKAKMNAVAAAMQDRLLLTKERIEGISKALLDIVQLPDPLGYKAQTKSLPSGIEVQKMRIPLGVIAMIYEARPNVTAEAAALCLKAGNAVILRGGSEALHSNLALADVLHQTLTSFNLPKEIISVVSDPAREVIHTLLTLNESIDLVIPRGGEGLIRFVTNHSRIPVIQHFKGVCHLYVDKAADLQKALAILVNGKTQRPSACNALETLLVHQDIAEPFLTMAATELNSFKVMVHGCENSQPYFVGAIPATEADYHAEYLAQEIAVKVVKNYEQAISHIQTYGSNHTEVIVTEDPATADDFVRQIHSSVVMVNASSRFSDGGELGLGSEIGISTSKLHAYGPMGLEALTTEKFVVKGQGQVRI
ncbi:glutamate-5-semialdehyde dehydrogenase [Thalassotalea aquiviva]|uniref:glutamate-5-semialdehyde dehydrogenase n=1 Tax=Thalassotalea aquiviva TaxID=3242415 RepID=UPI00352A0D7A